jgi:hypothetical protein
MEAPSPVTGLLRPGRGEDRVVGESVISRPDQRRGQQGARPNRRLFSLALGQQKNGWQLAERRASISAQVF